MTDEFKREYEERGFVFRPQLLSAAEMKVLNDEVDRIIAAPRDDKRIIREKDGVTPRTIVNAQLWNDVFARLVRHPKLVAAVERLLGEPVYAWQMGINCKAAFNGDIWFWHQDYPAYLKDDHIPEPRMVNALIFLDDISHLNGPLMLVPGSHAVSSDMPEHTAQGTSYAFRYTTREVIEAEVKRAGIEVPTGPAGSVNFMNVNTLHGSGANLSPWSRRLITLTYNAMSNKATSRSVRAAHIVPDDKDVPAIVPLGEDCLTGLAA
ncbi:MAG: phytanoyl-CoA dioxygenase family protein [Hyphomicrobiaceae bacterium]